MRKRKNAYVFIAAITLYGILSGLAAAGEAAPEGAGAPQVGAPAPGSPGATLTREDKRMAYLVYKLLDKKGKIKGANIKRGAKLFYQNCRPCHGSDGKRFNFAPYYEPPAFIGQRAREEMPTFWHQINFGDKERGMEAYIDEFTLQELIDIAGFAQTLP